jgi:DNA-binding MarR family transcriptional regulator
VDVTNLRSLRLLEAVEAKGDTTQRDLARDLKLSLGLVNSLIKTLVREGYFSISTIPGNRTRYSLTPKGVREKSRLTAEFIQHSIGYYRSVKAALHTFFSRLEKEGVRCLAFYGCGEVAELAYLVLRDTCIGFAGIFEAQGDGRMFIGERVQSLDALPTVVFDYVVVTQTENIRHHRECLIQAGVAADRVLHLGDTDV